MLINKMSPVSCGQQSWLGVSNTVHLDVPFGIQSIRLRSNVCVGASTALGIHANTVEGKQAGTVNTRQESVKSTTHARLKSHRLRSCLVQIPLSKFLGPRSPFRRYQNLFLKALNVDGWCPPPLIDHSTNQKLRQTYSSPALPGTFSLCC